MNYKKIMIAIAAIVAVGTVTFVSCNKEALETSPKETLATKGNVISKDTKILYDITYGDICIGALDHNGNLDDILKNFNFGAEDYDLELVNAIKRMTYGKITEGQKDSLINDNDGWDYFTEVRDSIYSCSLIKNPKLVYNLISTFDSTMLDTISFAEVEGKVDSIQKYACQNLKEVDLFIVLSYTEMVRASSYYWMSPKQGGSGYGYSILTMYLNSQTKKDKPNTAAHAVGNAALADCATAAVGCLLTAVVGAACPAAAGPMLSLTVRQSAKQSAKAAIKTVVKDKLREKPRN